ncbi:MAG: glycosyltransferase family 2 protein, partial [Candidatus Nanohaloarchaea archaeon]
AIPNYNGGEKLRRAIESCKNIALDEEKFEIKVLDNKSEDNSVDIVKELQGDFSNLRLNQNKKNLGRIGNWNKCIEESSGRYMIFLFVNEQISPQNNIDQIIKELESRELPFAKSSHVNLSETKSKEKRNNFQEQSVRRRLRRDIFWKGSFSFGPLQTYVFRTKILEKYEQSFKEEYDIIGDQDFVIDLGRKIYKKEGEDLFLATNSRNIVWDDETDRFNKKYDNSDDIRENLKWYQNENISDYSRIPSELIAFVRLSNINIYRLLNRISLGKFSDRLSRKPIKDHLGWKYTFLLITSYFYVISWARIGLDIYDEILSR